MNILEKFLEGGEQNLFQQTKGIVGIALSANVILEDIINGKAELEDVRKLRKQAERESFNISRLITSGAIAPNLIDDMILLINNEENITDYTFNLARHMLRYKMRNVSQKKYLLKSLRAVNELSCKAIKILHSMHSMDKISEIRAARTRIKALEAEGDVFKDAMMDFAYASTTDFKSFYYVIELAHLSDDILDACEDSADIFMSIMLSITT